MRLSSRPSNLSSNRRTPWQYAAILPSWQLDSFMTWLMTSWELPLMSRHRMPHSMVIHRPLMSASYSATLFDEGKWSQTMYLMRTLRGDTKTSPTPAPFFISDPSKYIVHYS